METMEMTQEAYLHDVEYIITISSRYQSLNVIIEEKLTGSMWKGQFSSHYIEDITQKTGNFKDYLAFTELIFAALKQNKPSVYLDVLTPQDLEILKSHKTGCTSLSASSQSFNASKNKGGKRYMILTLMEGSSKTHYPLPLNYEENPEPDIMRNTITRLTKELSILKSKSAMSESGLATPKSVISTKTAFCAPTELIEENEILKRRDMERPYS